MENCWKTMSRFKKKLMIWYDLFSCSASLSSSFEAKKTHASLCSDSLFQNRFPVHPPSPGHKVLLGNRLGGVLCEGFICRLGTLRSRLRAPSYDWVGSLPWKFWTIGIPVLKPMLLMNPGTGKSKKFIMLSKLTTSNFCDLRTGILKETRKLICLFSSCMYDHFRNQGREPE